MWACFVYQWGTALPSGNGREKWLRLLPAFYFSSVIHCHIRWDGAMSSSHDWLSICVMRIASFLLDQNWKTETIVAKGSPYVFMVLVVGVTHNLTCCPAKSRPYLQTIAFPFLSFPLNIMWVCRVWAMLQQLPHWQYQSFQPNSYSWSHTELFMVHNPIASAKAKLG